MNSQNIRMKKVKIMFFYATALALHDATDKLL
jgi:hypothetical protein